MSKLITIAGTGRSGTNVLKTIFGSHPDVASLHFETRFLIDPRGLISFYRFYTACWSPYMADYLIKDLEDYLLSLAKISNENSDSIPYADWELDRWIPNYSELVTELIQNLTQFNYEAKWPGAKVGSEPYTMSFGKMMEKDELAAFLSTFMIRITGSICASQGKSLFVDDNTHAILFASDINELLPSSKLIHIVRDPRDVISSLLSQKWTPNTVEYCTFWYKNVVKKWMEQQKLLSPDFFTPIKLEDLVAEPEKHIKELCTFCSITFNPKMLTVSLSESNSGRYLIDLTQDEIEFIEKETAAEAAHLGYTY